MSVINVKDAYREAVTHHQAGRIAEAEAVYREILAQHPDHADAMHLLGVITHQHGRSEEAVAAIQHAIALRPDKSDYHQNLGAIWQQQRRLDEAEVCFRTALRLDPRLAEAHSSLGAILTERGELDEAERFLQTALEIRPEFPEARFHLGRMHESRGNLAVALREYAEALRLQPTLEAAHLRLGYIQRTSGNIEAAERTFRAVLVLNPSSANACNELGNVARHQGDLDEALRWYRRATELDPRDEVPHSNLLYAALFHPDFDETSLQREHERWRLCHAAALEAVPAAHRERANPHQRLRVGYVSPFFHRHVIGWNLLPLFRRHDHREFEIVCYSDVLQADEVTAEFRVLADCWIATSHLTDEQLAMAIAEDEIDILVDLSLHMQNRLLTFARRPAPVQMTFAAYPGTTGLKSIQYRLTDEHLDPPGRTLPYTEESLRLKSFWCFMPLGDEPIPGPPPSRANGYLTFGCLNMFGKVTTPTLRLWAQVLRAVPDSRLLLLSPSGPHRIRTLELLQAESVDPSRIEFVPRSPHADYMATYQRVDIVLDTLPYNGHTTSCDALWMGVPVVTLVGQTVAGRAGLSQLTNIGHTELIAYSPAEFVAIAVGLAADALRLAQLRATLRSHMQASPLMAANEFARGIEEHYRAAWQRTNPREPTPTNLSTDQASALARQWYQAGRAVDAEALCRKILTADPQHADTLNLLGIIALQFGHAAAAVDLIQRAIAVQPAVPDYHNNIALALDRLGRVADAVAALRRALELNPNYSAASNNLGQLLARLEHQTKR